MMFSMGITFAHAQCILQEGRYVELDKIINADKKVEEGKEEQDPSWQGAEFRRERSREEQKEAAKGVHRYCRQGGAGACPGRRGRTQQERGAADLLQQRTIPGAVQPRQLPAGVR